MWPLGQNATGLYIDDIIDVLVTVVHIPTPDLRSIATGGKKGLESE